MHYYVMSIAYKNFIKIIYEHYFFNVMHTYSSCDAKEWHLTLSDVIIVHAYSIDRYFMTFRELKRKKNGKY